MNAETTRPDNRKPDRAPDAARDNAISQASDFIIENKTWMLSTCGSDHVIRSRPMLNINEVFNGDLYFFVRQDDKVLRTICENPQVNIVISEPSNQRYASITGKAHASDDSKKSELLWNQQCVDWFESENPGDMAALIRVDVDDIEFWDSHQLMLSRFGKLLTAAGPGLSENDIEHQKIDWRGGRHPVTNWLLQHHGQSTK